MPEAMTLKDWKARLQVGVQLRCSYRHYAPTANETITIRKVQTNAVAWDYGDGSGCLKLKPTELAWMQFPKKDLIRFTDDGFELLNSNGSLLSRYHWLPVNTTTAEQSD